ncbi:hypothetical protein TWF696_003153 [Orbilia brochopaga]|uniref:Peptide hydrolase n=1 Tax=Orbilia brochopaga TaxID=3140254 RepID=A0AAV9U062_9PEZI
MYKMKFTYCTSLLAIAQLCAALPLDNQESGDPFAAITNANYSSGLHRTLLQFDQIASRNHGNRAFGYRGFDASVQYVLSRLSALPPNSQSRFRVWTESFYGPPDINKETIIPTFVVNRREYTVHGLTVPVIRSWTSRSVFASVSKGPAGTKACGAPNAPYDPNGALILVEHNKCTTYTNANLPPARALLVYNREGTANWTEATVPRPQQPNAVPVGYINRLDALEILRQVDWAPQCTVWSYMKLQAKNNLHPRDIGYNIFAETIDGNADYVVVAGAHLDSSGGSAGINDNASGSAALLELFDTLQKSDAPSQFTNKIRFAWWGNHVDSWISTVEWSQRLSDKDARNIAAYIDLNKIGKGYYGILKSGATLSGETDICQGFSPTAVEDGFREAYASLGVTSTPVVDKAVSEDAVFRTVFRKPYGGITGGPDYQCQDKECDYFGNVAGNIDMMALSTRATARVLVELVNSAHRIWPWHARK